MTTIRTTLNACNFEARRLLKRGYRILHVDTYRSDDCDATAIVWVRPARFDEFPSGELAGTDPVKVRSLLSGEGLRGPSVGASSFLRAVVVLGGPSVNDPIIAAVLT